MTHHRLRLGNRRRQLLKEAASGPCIVGAGFTQSERSARCRAAKALARAGLTKSVRVWDYDAAGRYCHLVAVVLTNAGAEVFQAWRCQIENGGAIRWSRFEQRIALRNKCGGLSAGHQ